LPARNHQAKVSVLDQAIGLKPSSVGWSWKNDRLVSVTVTFGQLYQKKSLAEVADAVRSVVAKDFERTSLRTPSA